MQGQIEGGVDHMSEGGGMKSISGCWIGSERELEICVSVYISSK